MQQEQKKIAIDLTWVRPGKVGGTESTVRNLLDGFAEVNPTGVQFFLITTNDNYGSFIMYKDIDCFEIIKCDVISNSQRDRVLWQNTKMGKLIRKNKISICLEPVYGKPFLGTKGIKFITIIHDLQALHFPQYFSRGRVIWMKISWKNAIRTSYKVIAISEYVKNDILANYNCCKSKIDVIYDAVSVDTTHCVPDDDLEKYGVKKQCFYYTVSSLFLHKNIKTIVLAIAQLKRTHSKAFFPLIVSGIGGRKRDELDKLISENDIKDDVIFTAYVKDEERNMLYKTCRAFLFPSVFEGFGMPPIEAMAFGVPVITTRMTSIPEITGELCIYVDDPLSVEDWCHSIASIKHAASAESVCRLQERYSKSNIARQYIWLFNSMG